MIPSGNRGMLLEQIVENTNLQYGVKGVAQIQKVATPIKIEKTMPGGKIIAHWDKKSTVDFIGCTSCGMYICFDTKETTVPRLPLDKIKPHQIQHLKKIYQSGGISFILVWFRKEEKCYVLPYAKLEAFIEAAEQKSIPIRYFEENAKEVYFGENGYALNFLSVE